MKPDTVVYSIKKKPGESLQESDYMEQLPGGGGQGDVDSSTEHVRLVSLGNNCGPKLSFKHIGRGAETLPFDWVRTRLDGILHFLRNDFAGFFDFMSMHGVPGKAPMVMYRNYFHSFWHDNPRDAGMHERYTRRIERFLSINAEASPVLFVRVATCLEELKSVEELLNELMNRFGDHTYLLLVLNHQVEKLGPVSIPEVPHLMIYFLSDDAHEGDAFEVYSKPVRLALVWAAADGQQWCGQQVLPNVNAVFEAAQEITNGHDGLGGLPAFEENPAQPLHEKVRRPGEPEQPFNASTGERVEVPYYGQWYAGVVTNVQDGTAHVQCDIDEPGVIAVAPLTAVRPPATR